jgi:RHS repeat-associated protein
MLIIATVASAISTRMISNLCKVALFAALATFASAQTSSTDGSTPLGIAPGAPAGSFALSDFDNVNLFNGNLNFHLPLLRVGGRGSAGYTMTLKIDSKNWRVVHSTDAIGMQHFYSPSPNWWWDNEPAYRAGELKVRWAGYGIQPCFNATSEDEIFQFTLTRMTFTLPDGTEYELRDQLTNGQPLPITTVVPCPNNGHLRGRVFSTADGSSVTFIADTDYHDDPYTSLTGSPSGDLLLPDGTRYRIDSGRVTWIRDRNGNRLTFTYDALSRMTVTDSLNRQVTVDYGNPDVITYKGAGGVPRTIRVWRSNLQSALRPNSGYSIQTSLQLFPELNSASSSTQYNPLVISSVELPDGRQYRFYYNPYGELARVELPTGGAIEYDYAPGIVGERIYNYITGSLMDGSLSGVTGASNSQGGDEYEIYRRVVERRVYSDGATLDTKITYSRPESYNSNSHIFQNDGFVVMDQYNSGGTLLARSKHYYAGSARSSLFQGPIDYSSWIAGKETKTEWFNANGTTMLRQQVNTWQQRAAVSWWPSGFPGSEPPNDPRLVETNTSLLDANLVSKQTFGYDQYNNQTDVYEYDFGVDAPGPLIRRTQISYLTTNGNQGNVNYATDNNIHIRNLPAQKIVYDASGNVRAQTDFIYDDYGAYSLVDCPSIVQHDGGFNTGYGTRGNLTAVILRNPGGSPSEITLRNQYDIAGNLVKVVDGRTPAGMTTFEFNDRFDSSPDDEAQSNDGPPELAGGLTYAFPTKVTNALNALNHTTYTQYDYYLGKPVNAEDANGVVSSVAYNDPLDRPTTGVRAIGTSASNQTVFVYNDSDSPVNGHPARSITTISDKEVFGESNSSNGLKSVALYDGLGRTWRGATYEGSTWLITDTRFDALGRVSHVSSPYRAADPDSASAPDDLWTETVYDSLGRAVDVATPDGAHVITQYTGNQVLVVDPAGKRRQSETDALGRLTRVTEDPGNLNYETYYSYDALDNLQVVTQHEQMRTFTYDALSRLISATNPESGTITYAYDPNGNLKEKTDARGVKTTMTYDALNRIRSKSYAGTPSGGTEVANATPAVNYFYDDYSTLPSGAPSWPGTPSKGRLIGVTYGTGTEGTYYKYDAAGRITTNHQRQGTSNYATDYTYNLAGGLTREQRGNYVNNVWREYFRNSWTYDSAGRLSGMQASLTPFLSFVTLVGDISYAPFGGVQSETYGNGLIHSIGYNNRLQPTEIRLGIPGNLESVFTIYYMYGIAHDVNDPDPEIAPIHNNGNIARFRYSVSGTVQYSQTFQYDPLNRIRYAVEHNNGSYNDGTRAWYQTFECDRYGNCGIDVENTSDNVDGENNALRKAEFSEANNRITRAGFVYDAAGNLTAEPGKSYTYDAENRMVTATVGGVVTSQYVYDGNGRRVKKITGGVGTRFEYGAGGELIAERNDTNGTVTKVYLYKGGELLATTTNGTAYQYATADHLGTPRAWTDGSGNVVTGGRHDYLPFGEELFAEIGTRTAAQGYGSDTQQDGQRKQFGSYERDSETDLYFAQARYFASMQGRFTSVDPLMASAKVEMPGSWNRYAYCYNNPLVLIDPDGMDVQILDARAKGYVLNTLPQNIRKQVEAQIDKAGRLSKGALDKIKSKDGNFLALKEMVNASSTTEVVSASSDGTLDFDYKSVADVRKDSYNALIKGGYTPKEARAESNKLNEPESYLGKTLSPSESPSGNLRIIISDATGKASGATMVDLVGTTGHELYGHGLLYTQGKPWEHGTGPSYKNFFLPIEKRSKANYRGGLPKQANPRLVKPRTR